jgi:hypothetical protein
VRLPNTEPEVVFTSWKPVMAMAACDWAWTKMDTNTINIERHAAIFMVLKLAKTRTSAPGGFRGLVDFESLRLAKNYDSSFSPKNDFFLLDVVPLRKHTLFSTHREKKSELGSHSFFSERQNSDVA